MNGTEQKPMGEPTPEQVAHDFVELYYKTLHEDPSQLYRYYDQVQSVFSHGVEGDKKLAPAKGHQEIDAAIKKLGFTKTQTVIRQVDPQLGPGSSIIIQVIGWLCNGSQPMRKFCQTFCLSRYMTNGRVMFHISNDIFRFLKEEDDSADAGQSASASAAPEAAPKAAAPEPASPARAPEKAAEPVAAAAPSAQAAPAAVEVPAADAPVAEAAVVASDAADAVQAAAPAEDAKAPSGPVTWAQRASNNNQGAGSAPRATAPMRPQASRQRKTDAGAAAGAAAAGGAGAAAAGAAAGAGAGAAAAAGGEHAGRRGITIKSPALFIKNVPVEASLAEISASFQDVGAVKACEFLKRGGAGRLALAVLAFEDNENVAKAVAIRTFKVNGSDVVVTEYHESGPGMAGRGRGRGGGRGRGRGDGGRGRGRGDGSTRGARH